ncbi:MAG TPA: 5-oxoprolinase subunit PxpB [Clostridia bacterium]|nr:5-oxoprolinase subunit PxpB [Clostridia bacterium]
MNKNIRFLPAGDSSIVMEFGKIISPQINLQVQNMARAITKAQKTYILETIPTYRSLLINYDPLEVSFKLLVAELSELMLTISKEEAKKIRIVEIPVFYGGDYGPDLDFVAKHNKISPEEVVDIHSSRDYLVYMLGFTPGFPYLGGMDERISAPRLTTPRIEIPPGSVGIAGSQTGIYPLASPGGWQLIGCTPVQLYDPLAEPPALLKAGDYVRFLPIKKEEFSQIKEQVEKTHYQVNIIIEEGVS